MKKEASINTQSISPPSEGSGEVNITECPRDGQQSLPYIILPEKRAAYINELLQVGFDVIDFGSFVSPKAIPQMADTDKVLSLVDKTGSRSKLLAIVGNLRGVQEAAAQEKVDIIGFPYSISDTFLKRNINSSIDAVFQTTMEIKKAANTGGKQLRVYISMAFGNPYGDEWSEEIVKDHVQKLVDNGITAINLSDTVGMGTPQLIESLYEQLLPQYPGIELGIHLHTKPEDAYMKLNAAWQAGCRHFDGVLNGIGGCPMTGYELQGNVNTLEILRFCKDHHIKHGLDEEKIKEIAEHYHDFSAI